MEKTELPELTTLALPLVAGLSTLGLLATGVAEVDWALPNQLDPWGLTMAGVGYALAEWFSPLLPGLGRFPLSAGAWLAGATLGPAFWIPGLTLGFLGRWWRSRNWLSAWSDSLVEAWSALGALWALAPWQGATGALIYLLGWLFLPGLLGTAIPVSQHQVWGLARERGLALVTFLVWLGGCTAPGPVLLAIPLLSLSVRAQLRVLEAERRGLQQARVEKAQHRTFGRLEELKFQVDLQRADVELQQRVFRLLGELFAETALVESADDLRKTLLTFIRRSLPCARLDLLELEGNSLQLTGSQGPESLRPGELIVQQLQLNGRAFLELESPVSCHLAARIPDRGWLILSHDESPWNPEHHQLLLRLVQHLPLCLDAIRFRQYQSRILLDEQNWRQDLHHLAARLSATLDLLGHLVACRTVEELALTTQEQLPLLIQGIEVELEWREQRFLATPPLERRVHWDLGQRGSLHLGDSKNQPWQEISPLDRELLNLFSWQLTSLLEGVELNQQLRRALEQLQQSQAQLIQSSKLAAIGQLAAGVAHELNTPLGAMSLAIELSIQRWPENPEGARKRLQRALESAEQMRSIIAKLLSYSRDNRGLCSLVDLSKVLEDSYQLVAHTLRMAGIEIALGPMPELKVQGNANELQQVVSNLLLNAKDACLSPGAIGLRIELWLEARDNQAQIHVKDQGCGIEDSLKSRIFDPFFTTKGIGQGTGLGLSTSMELVQQHYGNLSCINSAPGRGSHFMVSLPLHC